MTHAGFAHLRVHTAYSLSEGAIRIGDLAKRCRELAMPAVAMTDTSNLFGALEFSLTTSKSGVQPIVGCQIALTGGAPATPGGKEPEPDPLVLLAQDEQGYANLLKLSSAAFLKTDPGKTPQVGLELLRTHSAGLICLTGGTFGPLGRRILDQRAEDAERLLLPLAEIYPDKLYIELHRHEREEDNRVEEAQLELAYKHRVPIVATNDCFFPASTMYEAHDALLCIAGGTYVGQADRRRVTPHHYLKSAEEMRELFGDLPEAVDNTLVIAQRCAYAAPVRKPILPHFETHEGRSEAEELAAMADQGLEARLQRHVFMEEMDDAAREEAARPYRERLEHELAIINQMGFPGYFLIVSDFIQWAKAREIPVGPGRGSGAGSVVAWSLTITDLDPLRFGLLFERFLNPERVSMPDFDIDFCQDRRDEVIRYVQDKYGYDQVAQIITFGKLQARAAVRDVGRVLEMPYGQVDKLSKMIPNNPANLVSLAQAIEMEPRLEEERLNDENVARLIEIALELEGLYRHASTHAAGVVIGDRPLDELVPLYRDPRSDMPVTQFSMKYAEMAGLVKFDFLGLKTLTVLDRARELIRRRGEDIDFAALPLDDRKTYELLGRGETVGVFQLESSGMRDVLRKLKPDSFEDIIALVALYRPGPMDNIPNFINCKHGNEKPDYLHPWLEPVLTETYGVIIYQEQVMEIAKILGGYSLGEADLLRRAMGKKIKAEMDAQRERFVSGAKEQGVEKARANYIFDLVAKFAGYGFNKSHAAAYALVAFQTAYLKANYPVEFLAASMSLDINNTDKLNVFRQELARMKIELLPPDINRSGVELRVERESGEGAVRYALAAIKNVGAEAMRSLVAEREKDGPFRSLLDFASRMESGVMNRRQLENLVLSGSFDRLNDNRAQVLAGIEMLIRYGQSAASERERGQVNLFGGEEEEAQFNLPNVAPWTSSEALRKEFDAIGFYLSGHPLDAYATTLEKNNIEPSAAFLRRLNGQETSAKLAGTVLSVKEIRTRKGKPLAFVALSDASGMFEVTLFDETLSRKRAVLEAGSAVVISVRGRMDDDQPRIQASDLQPLDQAAALAIDGVKLFLGDPGPLELIGKLLGDSGPGRGKVCLVMKIADQEQEVEIGLAERYAITPGVRQALKHVPGVIDVHDM